VFSDSKHGILDQVDQPDAVRAVLRLRTWLVGGLAPAPEEAGRI
jgi:hypothetical protein